MCANRLLRDNYFCSFCVDSGFRRVLEDQMPRLVAKIKESFPKFAEDENYIQKIVDIVSSCIYDERLVSLRNSAVANSNMTRSAFFFGNHSGMRILGMAFWRVFFLISCSHSGILRMVVCQSMSSAI